MRLRSNPLVCRVTIVALLFALNAGAIPALGQQSITSATLSGRIDDASGAAIIGATVAVTNLDKNLSWTVKTDDQGRYYFLYLPVGRYELKVEQPGFAAHGQHLTLSIGQAIDVPIRLVVNAVAEKINVIASGTIVETVRTQVAEAVLPVEIEQLPLNGRNYLDLALLVPGVSRTNTGSNQRFAETSAVPGTGISVGGQRNLNNGFIVDGLSANDDAADLAGTFFSQEVIREFQVITSGAVAEFGRASSGVVNIITKSGTNDWRGSLYGFLRSRKLDARNPLAPRKDPLTQAQYGASIGGPIARDTTFVFANFEQTRRNDSNVITVAPSNVAAINARLDQIDFRGPRIETGLVPGGFDVTNIFARLDHRLDENNLFALRYSFYDISAINSRTVGGLNSVSRGTGVDNRDQTFAVSNVTTLSSRTLNEARFQFTQSRLDAPVNDETGPAVNITGIASFGTATFSPLARDIDLYEIVDNVSTLRGSHSLKAGADFLYNRVNIFFPGALQGVYTFSPSAATAASPAVSALSNFLAGSYSSFQQAFGEASQFQSNPNVGLYLQDEWRPLDRLTINAGLRYDLQFLPDPINTDRDNFAPRLGVAYAPGDRKTVIRASYGLYYDRIPLRATSNALQRDGSKYIVVQMSSSQPGAPVFPNALATVPDTLQTKPNITRIDPDIENSYSQHANVQIERELWGDARLSVGYMHLRGLHLILSRNVNVPRFPASAGVPNLGRPDPNFGNIGRFESSGDSYYNGMIVAFHKRATSWASVRASYTLSKSIDNAGNFFFSTPQDNFDLRAERGLSDNDQRHRLVLSGSLEAPRASDGGALRRAVEGLQLSYIFTYASRLPFNVQAGNDRNFDTNFNDRPAGLGRNTGRGFDHASLDIRLSRRFKLTERAGFEIIAEAFNALNRANFQLPNNLFGTASTPAASFGRPTAADSPRQIQFGLRASF